MSEEKTCSRPIARGVALLLWTALVGGAVAVSFLLIPRASAAFETAAVQLPALTQHLLAAGAAVRQFWFVALGGYLLGVVVIGMRAFDRLLGGVIVLQSLAVAALCAVTAAGVLLPLWELSGRIS